MIYLSWKGIIYLENVANKISSFFENDMKLCIINMWKNHVMEKVHTVGSRISLFIHAAHVPYLEDHSQFLKFWKGLMLQNKTTQNEDDEQLIC